MRDVAKVVVKNTNRSFDIEYSYIIPDEFIDKLQIGMRVYVPFGRASKKKEALVVKIVKQDIESLKEECRANTIKNIVELIDDVPIIDEDMLDIMFTMKRDYICTYYEAFMQMVPSFEKARGRLVKLAYLKMDRQEVLDKLDGNFIRNIWQVKILRYLLEHETIEVNDVVRFIGGGKYSINTLFKKGFIGYKEKSVIRDPYVNKCIQRDKAKIPTSSQAVVLEKIKNILYKEKYDEVLIHGVTGSGKTEVYMQLVEYCINKGKNAIVLVPEIALTPQIVDRFRARFGENIAVMHSRLSKGERRDQWYLIKEDKIKVVVGVRSAIFAPIKNIGVIIIDEEHETSYKSEVTPKYNAKDIARLRCKKSNAVLIYGSATPSVETYYKAMTNEIHLCNMESRTSSNNLPQVDLVDLRQELDSGNRSIFSYKLKDEIQKNIQNGEQTMLFLNRRGHSAFLLCRECGFVAKCVNCNVTMTYHKTYERLVCHYCGYTIKNFKECPKCKSKYIKSFGLGTEKLEEEVKKEFPEASVIRMDLDTTSYKNAHEEILSKFKYENINVLIGTQMIAKGHDFPNVTLVGVIAADAMLNVNDFRSEERTFELITQVAGRAGRGEKKGRVIVQTYNIDAYSIQTALMQDYQKFFDKEIELRRILNYPPFSDLGVATFIGANDKETFVCADSARKYIIKLNAKYNLGLDVLGVNRTPISKIKNNYRWRIIIKCSNRGIIIRTLTRVTDKFLKSKISGVNLSVDINPIRI